MAEQNQRQVAAKLRIADITQGKYVKEEGWTPNYVLTQDGKRASRVNLLGAVVSMPAAELSYRSITLDDGSGAIPVRSFDETDMFKEVRLGDVVFVIGRPREYGSEVYIMPEIIKKVQDMSWVEVRKMELENERSSAPVHEPEKIPRFDELPSSENVEEEKIDKNTVSKEKEEANEPNAQQKIYSLIKELDKGDGADFEL
ncbi:hypothetical protein JW707_00250, partial [Candidatus Woesearchaeota archaeon]|nr:hypothetical protein [Candidatus Woesearchaeota archaeon]